MNCISNERLKMNCALVYLFNVLLFKSCLTASIDKESSRSDIKHPTQFRNGTQSETFNEDFLYPIFDLADLEDMLQMAKNPETSDFVKNHIFPVKYQNYAFYFEVMRNENVKVNAKSIYISDFNLFVDVITHFGKHIKSLGIIKPQDINEDDSAVLIECISEQCSNSLTSLILGNVREYTFTQFTKQFPHMKTLHVNLEENQIGSILPWDELFPNLETLYLNYLDATNNVENNGNRFIESELPAMKHLNSLIINIWVDNKTDVAIIQTQLGNLLQKNQQIQNLEYYPSLNDFIQEIREYLPNLEYLTVHNIDSEIRAVRFESVKHFKVLTWGQTCPVDRISFSHLETLDMIIGTQQFTRDSWIRFFRNHQHLRRLSCVAFEEHELVDFLAELPNLHEIRIESVRFFNVDLVSRLIESPNNWTKFYYDAHTRHQSIDLDKEIIVEKFENEWNITYGFDDRSFVELERKIN